MLTVLPYLCVSKFIIFRLIVCLCARKKLHCKLGLAQRLELLCAYSTTGVYRDCNLHSVLSLRCESELLKRADWPIEVAHMISCKEESNVWRKKPKQNKKTLPRTNQATFK